MLHASHDPALVALSIAVAVFASYTSLDLASRVNAAGGRGRSAWLIGAAVALGGGIWSMHFIAMLAFSLGTAVAYDAGITIASLIAAVAVAGIGLFVVNRWPKRPGALLAAGAFTGIGVAVMHYTGMMAMQMNAMIAYDPTLVALSIAIAVTAATVALWLAFNVKGLWSRLAAALVMGAAIAAMHYTGMAATSFAPIDAAARAPIVATSPYVLAAAVAVATIVIMVLGIAATLVDRYIAFHAAEHQSLVSNVPGAVYRCRADWTAVFMSDAITEMTGYTPADFVTHKSLQFADLIHPEDRDHTWEAAGHAIAERRPYAIEYRAIDRRGVQRWFLDKAMPIFDADGRLTFIDGVIFDVTDRKKAELEVQETNAKLREAMDKLARQERFAMMGQIAATVSHELRNRRHQDVAVHHRQDRQRQGKRPGAARHRAGRARRAALRYHRGGDAGFRPPQGAEPNGGRIRCLAGGNPGRPSAAGRRDGRARPARRHRGALRPGAHTAHPRQSPRQRGAGADRAGLGPARRSRAAHHPAHRGGGPPPEDHAARQRPGHPRRRPAAHLRAAVHDQELRRRAGPGDGPPDRRTPRRHDRRGEPARCRRRLHDLAAARGRSRGRPGRGGDRRLASGLRRPAG
jgi:PAS domain S-box-containing protein